MKEKDKLGEDALQALKIAFTYMPRAIEVNRFDQPPPVTLKLSNNPYLAIRICPTIHWQHR